MTYYYYAKPYRKVLTLFRIEGVRHGKDRIKVARRVMGLNYSSLISPRNLHASPEEALKAARQDLVESIAKAEASLAALREELAVLPEVPGICQEEDD